MYLAIAVNIGLALSLITMSWIMTQMQNDWIRICHTLNLRSRSSLKEVLDRISELKSEASDYESGSA